MKKIKVLLLALWLPFWVHAQSGFITVSSVLQRSDGSGNVDIYYNLSGPESSYNISIEVSFDGGNSYVGIALNYLSGQLNNISPGSNRHIVWDGMGSHPNTYSNQAKLKLLATASSNSIIVPSEGLVAYYPFNGNANDLSGNANHGEVLGGAALTTGRNGEPNNAYNFGGYYNSSAIKINNNSTLFFSDQFTISAWYNLHGHDGMDGWGNYKQNGTHCVISKDGDRGGFQITPYGIGINNSSSNIVEHRAGTSDKPEIGKWTHIVAVVDATSVEFFVDGNSVGKNTYNHVNISTTNTRNLYIGRYGFSYGGGGSGWFPFNGDIDDVRIYNRALTYDEVQALYNE